MATWPTTTDLEQHLNIPGGMLSEAALSRAVDAAVEEITVRTRFASTDIDIPADVAMAALLGAAKLYNRRNTPDGIAGDGEFGVIRTSRFDSDAERLIRPYLTIPIVIV